MNRNPSTSQSRVSASLIGAKWPFYWLCGFVLSFAYERPFLHVSSLDRVNPRLFDIMVLVGIVTVLPHLPRTPRLPSPFRIWRAIVAVFCFCALVWSVGILPWEYGKYSLYFAAMYVEGLIGIYIAIQVPLDKREKRFVHYVTVAGGAFVALYCIPQYLSGDSSVTLSSGVELSQGEGAFIGPLGYGYYHLAMFSGMSSILALALVPQAQGLVRKVLLTATAAFVVWPAFFCGSRTGLSYTGVGFAVMILVSPHARRWTVPIAIVTALTVSVALPTLLNRVVSESTTFKRLSQFEESDNNNDISSRFLHFRDFNVSVYKWNGFPVPFIGAGFYVAPTFVSGTPRYRVGYGFHNAYLFAFEQGGVAAFVLFIAFLRSCWKHLRRAQKTTFGAEKDFADAMFAILVATLVIGIAGHGFWFGSTMHFSFYLLLLYIIAGRSAKLHRPVTERSLRTSVA